MKSVTDFIPGLHDGCSVRTAGLSATVPFTALFRWKNAFDFTVVWNWKYWYENGTIGSGSL